MNGVANPENRVELAGRFARKFALIMIAVWCALIVFAVVNGMNEGDLRFHRPVIAIALGSIALQLVHFAKNWTQRVILFAVTFAFLGAAMYLMTLNN